MLPSAWLTAGGVPPGVAASRAVWRQGPDSDCSDESDWDADEEEVASEAEERAAEFQPGSRLFFSSKTGTGFKAVYYDRGGAPESHKSSLAEPYLVTRRGEELLYFKTALGAAVFYADYVFAKHGRTAKGGGQKGPPSRGTAFTSSTTISKETEEAEEAEEAEQEEQEAEPPSVCVDEAVDTFRVVKLRVMDRHPGLPEGWACSKHWSTSEPLYKQYAGPNGEVLTDQSLRKKWYDTKSTGSEPEAASAPAEASDDKHVTNKAAAMEEEAFEEDVLENEAAEDEAFEEEAAEEETVVMPAPPALPPVAGTKMDDERASVAAEDEASETDYMEEQQPQMPSPPPPSPVLPPPPPPSPVANDKRRAASGDLATSLDGAAWQLGASQQQGAGDEKRQRTSPKFFLAGAAPPPSALYAARCAQACAEQPRQEMAALSLSKSAVAEDDAVEMDEIEELPEELEELPEEARATGAMQTGLEPACWDEEEELEPETGHGNPLPSMGRNELTTRCHTHTHSSNTALACPHRLRALVCLQWSFVAAQVHS